MSTDGKITEHWTTGDIAPSIFAALEKAGVDTQNLTAEDLAPLDNMHGGGAAATREMMALLKPTPDQHLLDIGSGIGGPARLLASAAGVKITGIDLTQEFCDVAEMLTEKTGLSGLVSFQQGNALDLPFDDAGFDGAYTHNVTMNIPDKASFYAEACRVVKPGGLFVTTGLSEGPDGPPFFPVPWAKVPEDSHLVSPEETRRLLEEAGFEVVELIDRTGSMLEYYERNRQKAAAEGPPILSVHVILGDDGRERMKNSARSVEENRVVPIEIVCRKP
jgi:ubiquinone/menaquinone biosynthesis C-methylase UbiE